MDLKTKVYCSYCKSPAVLMLGRDLYRGAGLDQAYCRKWFWVCVPCGAWVGTHQNDVAYALLGRLANADLRRFRQQAHAAFDPLWKSGAMERGEAYRWLGEQLGVAGEVHIADSDEERCLEIIRVCHTWAMTAQRARKGKARKLDVKAARRRIQEQGKGRGLGRRREKFT